jgi:hypothetical protein
MVILAAQVSAHLSEQSFLGDIGHDVGLLQRRDINS